MRKLLPAAAAIVVLFATGTAPGAVTAFGPPVKVTPSLGFGYEPAVYTDHYGNVYVTAHKENWQLAIAPDVNSPTYTRSMSWAWYSTDGIHFGDLPGLTELSFEQHDFGDEGDMALDDAGHLYFVDTNVADVTFTRWTVSGLGSLALDFHRPLLPAGEPVDDRPWVTAHGNGHVFYFGNEGDKDTYGPGRYTVYQSYDSGQTFNPLGLTLPDSGWCRPAADHRPGSPYVYAFCTNDEGTLYSYVSSDDGQTFARYTAGTYAAADSTQSWPTVEVAPDGSVWALYVDGKLDANGDPLTNRLRLFHSTDHGKTWTQKDITPLTGGVRLALGVAGRQIARLRRLLPAGQQLRLACLRLGLQARCEAGIDTARSRARSGSAVLRRAGRPDGKLVRPGRHALGRLDPDHASGNVRYRDDARHLLRQERRRLTPPFFGGGRGFDTSVGRRLRRGQAAPSTKRRWKCSRSVPAMPTREPGSRRRQATLQAWCGAAPAAG